MQSNAQLYEWLLCRPRLLSDVHLCELLSLVRLASDLPCFRCGCLPADLMQPGVTHLCRHIPLSYDPHILTLWLLP